MRDGYGIGESAEVRRGFYRHFGTGFGDFYDGLMTVLAGSIRIDIVKFDEWLHRQVGDYEERGMSMAEAVEAHYGREATDFIGKLL